MSTTWKGQLSFGVLTIPVKIQTTIPRKPSLFSKAHEKCGTKLNQKSYCAKCDRIIDNSEVVKHTHHGQELTDSFLSTCKPQSDKKIHITGLVKHVDHLHFETPYALIPDNSNGLVSVIAQALGSRYAVGNVVLQARNVNVAVCVRDGMLMLWRLRRPADIDMAVQSPEKVKRADVVAVRSLLAKLPDSIQWVADQYSDSIAEFANKGITIGQLVNAATVNPAKKVRKTRKSKVAA